uniref:Peptidase_M13 domain-containing protein n=1 Tax=Strongyloides papillosus TaxID=174720 RepID=A0A0N5C7W1_STREA
MNVFIFILYTCVLFSVSQGFIIEWWEKIFGRSKDNSSKPKHNDPNSRILYKFLDLDVKPCDNFYKFACGKWIKTMEKEYGNFGSFNHRTDTFDKFANGEKKYNDESKMLSTLVYLRDKCSQDLPNDKVYSCGNEIFEFGKYALSSVFLRRNIKNFEHNNGNLSVNQIYLNIKEQFILLIDEKEHLFDLDTRRYFKDKINHLKLATSFDDHHLSNVEHMENCYYNSIGINYNDHISTILANINNLKALSQNDDLTTCRGKIFQISKFMPLIVYGNGLYDPNQNLIAINSGLVNEPSYAWYFKYPLNYGYLGNIMAHEMLHGFDSNNYNRTLANKISDYKVSQMSMENYEKKASCFVDQYNKQIESKTNMYIDGSRTLAENIVDNGGLKVAHRAYMKFRERNNHKNSPVKDFEQFNDEQLFFISVGRNFCEHKNKYILEQLINGDNHTPSEIRTNMMLSNYQPFIDAFNCPVSSKMNREHKCELWKSQKQN